MTDLYALDVSNATQQMETPDAVSWLGVWCKLRFVDSIERLESGVCQLKTPDKK